MNNHRKSKVFALVLPLVATSFAVPASYSGEEQTQTSQTAETEKIGGLSETEEIEQQIKRIEEKLKTEPKVKGWVLVGNAYMHLERFREAVTAYQNAYLIDDTNKNVRDRLKYSLYRAGLDDSVD